MLSERVEHVNYFTDKIAKQKIATCGKYVGQTKESVLKESLKCRIIVGTYSMIAEGFDCKSLDTLIMLTPKVDIKQIVGRILRKQASERTIKPLIIDISDEFSSFPKKTEKRIRYYSVREYDIKYFDVDGNKPKVVAVESKQKNKRKSDNNSSNKYNNYNNPKNKKRTFKFNDS